MSLWSEYFKERLDRETLETEEGFLTYKITGEACELFDIYVRPDKRREGVAWQLVNEVSRKALEAGAKRLIAYVWFDARSPEDSMQAQIAYGFKLHHSDGQKIILVKEIGV